MASKPRKRKGAPAIVPRFLKTAVTVGAIPALAAGCDKPRHTQPVVAYFAAPPPKRDADATQPQIPPPPAVALYLAPPPVAPDAGTDAPAATRQPPPPVVAALVPAVVAAYVPRDPQPVKKPKPKQP